MAEMSTVAVGASSVGWKEFPSEMGKQEKARLKSRLEKSSEQVEMAEKNILGLFFQLLTRLEKRQKRNGQRNKAGYTATPVVCRWAGTLIRIR